MVPHRHYVIQSQGRFLVTDSCSLHLGGVRGRAGRHRMHHVALGAGCLEELHAEFVFAVGAGNFQGRGHGLLVEAHHSNFIYDTFSVVADAGASIMHCIFSLEGESGQV